MSEPRWVTGEQERMVVPEIDAFLADIFEVYRKHNMSIGHEDGHGGFEIEELSEGNIDWLSGATDNR